MVIFLATALALGVFVQTQGGFSSDLGGDPDEAAHAVTALMVRDYLAAGLGTPPMTFAKTYYEDFPRVALGHYPPLYYLLTAPLLLPRPMVNVLLMVQVLTLAGLGTLTFIIGRRMLPHVLAAAAGTSVLTLPVGLKLTLHVMSDLLLALFCLWAALLWAWYLRAPSVRRALVWGCVAAAAILTKGSGMGLCLLPPAATLLAGRWRLVLSWSWWCAALPVAVLAGPWMLYSTKISHEGMTQLSPVQYFLEAVPFHLKATPKVFGWPLAALAAAGVFSVLLHGLRRRALAPETASLIAMSLGMLAVLLLVPVGLSTRYMLTLAPPVMLAAAHGLSLAPWKSRLAQCCKPVLLLIFALLPLQNSNSWPMKDVHGFSSAVSRSGLPQLGHQKESWLVASDPRGEGAIIAAAAFACPQRTPSLLRVYRGSKELAKSDWMGRGYQAAFVNSDQLLDHLDKMKVTRVFVDLSTPPDRQQPHEHQLLTAMQSANDRWHLDFEQPITRRPGETGVLHVYQRISPATADVQN
jgi:hypothetical protein